MSLDVSKSLDQSRSSNMNNSHATLEDKEINGVIDHADNSITTPKIVDGAITDTKIASITTRTKLPSTLAYEDENNTFTQTNQFDNTLILPRKSTPASPIVGEIWINGNDLMYRSNATSPLTITTERQSRRGIANGYAPLDGSSLLPLAHLPNHDNTKHVTAPPVGLGDSNLEGSSNAVARADHVHKREIRVSKDGTVIGTRSRINFTGNNIIVMDDATNDEIDISVSATNNSTSFGVNVKDYGALGDGVADDTNAFINAINALGPDGGIIYVPPGIYSISNLQISKHNVTIKGAGGYHMDNGNNVPTVLRQRSSNQPLINLQRVSNSHLNGFGLLDLGLEQHNTASVPLIDSSAFKKQSGEGSLNTPALKAFKLEKLTIYCKDNATSSDIIQIYNPDVNPVIRDIRANNVKHRLFAFYSSNHNSGNIFMENVTIGIQSVDTARLLYIETSEGNFTYNHFMHLRAYSDSSNPVRNNYMIELIGNANNIRWNVFEHLRTEECPLLLIRTIGGGDVKENWFRDFIYRDRRNKDSNSPQKIGIVINDANCIDNYFYNGKIFKGVADQTIPSVDIGIQDKGSRTHVYYKDIVFEDVTTHIEHSQAINPDYIAMKSVSGTFNSTTAGTKTITIPHGLGYTPNLRDITISISTLDDNIRYSTVRLRSVDSTNVTVNIQVTTAGTDNAVNVYAYIK